MRRYLFTNDTNGSGESTCADQCLANWPPLVVEDEPTVGDGLDAADFDTITATDGSTQLTFNGWPLYYFAGDSAPGDVNGQGVGDVWYVIDADGNAITTLPGG